MKLGSLFDGSGTAPLAASLWGIEPVWASEIEPYPIKVTTARFPNMKHLGDITQINGAEIEPVDIICGGSPCQDLSVAGKQAGIHEGERSHLFFEMTRIIKQMREATYGNYPKYVIWENVPGAFSSNNGEDFLEVLRSFAEIAEDHVFIPRPAVRRGKQERLAWTASGEVVGDGWSIAWRTVDAQYWGVPQRRRRIYLVADFADERAGEILFERKGVCGYPSESGTSREGTADDAAGSSGGSGGVKCLNPWDFQTIRQYAVDGVYPAITSNETGGQNRQGVCYAIDSLSSNSMKSANPNSGFHEETVSKTLQAAGTNPTCNQGGDVIVQAAAFMGGQGAKAGSVAYSEDISPTIKSVMSGGNTVPDVVYATTARTLEARHDSSPCVDRGQNFCVYALQGNGIDRADTAGCNGCGWRENECYTLNTIDRPAVVYPEIVGALNATDYKGIRNQNVLDAVVYDCRGNGDGETAANRTGDHENRVTDYTNCVITNSSGDGICGTIDSHYYKGTGEREGVEREIICMASGQAHAEIGENVAPTLTDDKDRFPTAIPSMSRQRRYIVRRLTPLECCRLQGFPNIVEVNMKEITRDELCALALAEGFIKVDLSTGDVYANRGPGGIIYDNYRILTGSMCNGYKVYSLHFGGSKKQVKGHRLVWIAAHGMIPDGFVVDHINNDKTDNRIANLQLLTARDNSTKAKNDGLFRVKEDASQAKITNIEHDAIQYIYFHTDLTVKRLSEIFGISDSRVHQIIHEGSWTDGVEGSDSAKYKMWGNGMALPNMLHVMRGIVREGGNAHDF